MSLMLTIRLSSFLCFNTAASFLSISSLVSVCVRGDALIFFFFFYISSGSAWKKLIWPNNVKSSSDMFRPWTCEITSITRERNVSHWLSQHPPPNTRPREFSRLLVSTFPNQSFTSWASTKKRSLRVISSEANVVSERVYLYVSFDIVVIHDEDLSSNSLFCKNQESWNVYNLKSMWGFTLIYPSNKISKRISHIFKMW